MNGNTEDKEDVIIFWDYEMLSSSSAAGVISTYEMVKNIRSAAAMHGPLKSIRLYWDYASHPHPSTTLRTRSELSASGVTLIDCPAEGRKGAATKKMLVDMIFHAWDNPLPFTFVVITGDRDLSYALAMLRMKTYRVVLISPAGSHPDLTSQVSLQLDWSRTILGINGGSNEDDLFRKDSPNPPASSSHVLGRPSASSKPASGTFTFRPDLPPATPRDSPGLAHKPSAFSSSYDHGFNVFGGPRFSSPKSTFELGDGPLFPRSFSKPLHSRSGSLSDALRPIPLINKDKKKVSEPEDILHPPPPPPSSGSRLQSSTSIFEPINDEDDGLPIPRPSPHGPATPEPVLSDSSLDSLQTKFSFEQISKPMGGNNGSEPVEQQPIKPLETKSTPSSSKSRGAVTTPSVVQQTETKPKPPPPRPPLPVVPAVTSAQASEAATAQKAKLRSASGPSNPKPAASSKPLPPAWVPLIRTLRKHNGVLSRSTIAPTLLGYYPDAFKTAGTRTIKGYLDAARNADIVSMSVRADGTVEIHLKLPYFP